MNTTTRFLCLGVIAAAIAFAGCSDDDDNPTGGGTADTTPPSVTSVTAIDAFHFSVTYNEDVVRPSADDPDNYTLVEATTAIANSAVAPGDTVQLAGGSLGADKRTVIITTFTPMSTANYDLGITGVRDVAGNVIATPVTRTFAGTDATDNTPPMLVSRTPAPGATGVPLSPTITLQFSEVVDELTVEAALSWEPTAGGLGVSYFVAQVGWTDFIVVPYEPLELGTQYTVSLAGVEDLFGNTMPTTTWNFTTTSTPDNTPPTIVSTTPANGATNVDVNANLSITFSEPVNRFGIEPQITPPIEDGVLTWSNNDAKLTFDPTLPLETDQVYVLNFLPGSFEDLQGNRNAQAYTLTFSTGASLPSGGFRGTIAGHPGTGAADPTGGVVAAALSNPFGESDDFVIAATTVVAANDTYNMRYLMDDVYYPIVVKDSNGDNQLDPSLGDAIGAYGIDFLGGGGEIDSVTVTGGAVVNGVNFPIYDTSAIVGEVTYAGELGGDYPLFVGLFDPVGFDPTDVPLYGFEGSWPFNPRFAFNFFDDNLADGEYIVAAFIDANFNGMYDAAVDPAGVLGSTVTVENGSDALGLVLLVADPPPATAPTTAGVAWPTTKKRSAWLQTLAEALRTAPMQ